MTSAKQVECSTHGSGSEAFLCRHLVESSGLDFHRDEPNDEYLYPDAWCHDCEMALRRVGGWDKVDWLNAPPIALVCGHCYDIILLRHQLRPTTIRARLARLFARSPPAKPAFKPVTHDEAVLAASRRARDRLRGTLKPRFIAGLPQGERLMVKAPFKTPAGGLEWMWVRIARWDGPRIHGVLENDPVHVRNLRAGAHVEVREDDVLDYILFRDDGSKEGNETAELLHGKH